MLSVRLSGNRASWLIHCCDGLSALSAPFAACALRNLFEFGTFSFSGGSFAVYAVISALMSVMMVVHTGCSRITPESFSLADASRSTRAIAFGVAFGAAVAFACTRLQDVARAVPFVQAAFQVAGFVAVRLLYQRMISTREKATGSTRFVLVVGCRRIAVDYLNAVRELSGADIVVAGFVTHAKERIGQTIGGKKILGTIADIENVISTLRVHGVDVGRLVVATREDELTAAEAAGLAAADRRMAHPRLDALAIAANLLGDAPAAEEAAVATSPVVNLSYLFTKRAVDIVGSLTLLILTAPVMLVLCAVVALDSGMPIIFWQQRLGRNDARLTVYKFRTMRDPLDAAGRLLSDAQRLSVVGRWMRVLRLDELPQLISILKGDMSFVGPRPLLPVDQPEDAGGRLSVKPGLTGWAQVHGGNLVAPEDKNALDLWYIAHASLWLDVVIVLRTIRMVMQGDLLDRQRIEEAKVWVHSLRFATQG